MLGSSALPTFPIDVRSGPGIDVSRQGTSTVLGLNEAPLATSGTGALFAVTTVRGDARLTDGLVITLRADRDFIGAPALKVDHNAPLPWLDVSGVPLTRVVKDRIYRVVHDGEFGSFRSSALDTVGNSELTPSPAKTIKGNAGTQSGAPSDLSVSSARSLLQVDRLDNTSDFEKTAPANPIGALLAGKATPGDIAAATGPLANQIANIAAGQSSNSLAFDTKAQLDASLGYGANTLAQVLSDGDNNGLYAKLGASGAGSWTLKTQATVPGIDTRTAEVQLRPAGTLSRWSIGARLDGVVRTFLRLTPQGDIALPRLRVDRISRRYGGTRGGIFGPRQERLAYLNARLDWCVRSLRMSGHKGMGAVAGRIVAAQRHMPLVEFLKSGRVRLALDPSSFIAARLAAARPPEDVIVLGAQGRISDVMVLPGPGRRISYRTDADGVASPYVARRDLAVQGAHIWLPGQIVEVDDSYGQSWRSLQYDVAALGLLGFEPRRALTFGGISNGQLVQVPTQGSAAGVDPIVTFMGLGSGLQIGIGALAAIARQRLRDRNRIHGNAILDINHAYPGYRWDQLAPGTDPWVKGIAMRTRAAQIAAQYGAQLRFRAVGWTHGAPEDGMVDGNGVVIDYNAALAAMVAGFDDLGLNGLGGERLHFFTDQTAPVASRTQAQVAILTQAAFALANASRVHLIGPRYPYAMQDEIHHTALGTARIGDLEAYVKHVVLDLGQSWTPARPTGIAVAGNTVTIAVARPYGMGDLALDIASIEAAPQFGFHVRVGGSEIPVSNVVVGTDSIALTLASAVASGTNAEVSYAFYGPGSPVGTHSGVWGNVKRVGPASVLLPNRTTDTWLTVFRQTVPAS